MTGWEAWTWDWPTALWAQWIVQFAMLETWALLYAPTLHPLTAHLRPIFQADPLTWFLALGAWLWIGFHFLVQGVFLPPGPPG